MGPIADPQHGTLAQLRLLAADTRNNLLVTDNAAFPEFAIQTLTAIGVLMAPLPRRYGGLGLGTEPGQGRALLSFLHLLGQVSLPLGRLIEAHVNALRIVTRYGNVNQQDFVSELIVQGNLGALWVTDPPDENGLHIIADGEILALAGRKMFCSGAGQAGWAVVTAYDAAHHETRLLLVDLGRGERASALPSGLGGMRAAVTGQVDFTGVSLGIARIVGASGDYLKEPDFSGGAWRSSAVALGGLYRLLALLSEQLRGRGRQDDPHQRARFGQALIAHETGRLWLEEAGSMAEDLVEDPARIVSTVGLARIAVERACLDGIELVQRSLGLSAFMTSNPVERVARDLQTYLRQPAADEVLHNAAGYFVLNMPPSP